jgi:cAMP receptor-like G-protein coupled receptor
MAYEPFSSNQERALVAIAQTCAFFSLLGSVLVCLSWLRFSKLRNLRFHLVLMLAVSDIGANISYFIGSPRDGSSLCTFQGLIQQFFQLSVVLWTGAISYLLYNIAVTQRVLSDETFLRRKMHMTVWGIATVLSLLPFTTNSYGSTGAWCWIRQVVLVDVVRCCNIRFVSCAFQSQAHSFALLCV